MLATAQKSFNILNQGQNPVQSPLISSKIEEADLLAREQSFDENAR